MSAVAVSDYSEAAARLDRGAFVRLTVMKEDMRPFFRPGQDSVLLAPVRLNRAHRYSEEELRAFESHSDVPGRKWRNVTAAQDRITVRRRDVVLVRTGEDRSLRLLRAVHVWGTLLLLRCDCGSSPYISATVSDVVGVVVEGTIRGGTPFRSTQRKWRYASKLWTASYRARSWAGKVRRNPKGSLSCVASAMALSLIIISCTGRGGADIIGIEDGQFIKNGSPYYFVGTNFWYGPILASEGSGGDRERLTRELDSLCSMGVRNLRVLVGSDGPRGVYTKVEPTLQYAPGKYNDTLLRGLDYFLVELGKRNMEAVLYLNNAWEWSGGYSQYLQWTGHGDIPLPRVAGYNTYVDYVADFIRSDSAKTLFRRYVMDIISRTNTVTGKAYRDDPAIFSWQICNEPRPFAADNKEAFRDWLTSTAELIKSIDPNHMVSVGSEGKYGCEVDLGLWEEIGRSPYIDYLNIHIWPFNWGWTSREDMASGNVAPAVELSREYLQEHLEIARRMGKPLVVEEFGFPRDSVGFSRSTSVSMRDVYYDAMLSEIVDEAAGGGLLAGFNFWGWGGLAEPSEDHLMWQPGDDYTGDPAQEEQGLYSVFASDTSTVRIVRYYARSVENIE